MGLTVAEQLEARVRRESLETVLAARFGQLPAEVRQALAGASSEAMSRWLRLAATAATLDEVGILPEQPSS